MLSRSCAWIYLSTSRFSLVISMAAPDERVTLADGEMRALDDLSLPVAGSAAADALVHIGPKNE